MVRQAAFKLPTPERKALRSLHEIIVGILKKYGPRKDCVLAKQLGASESHLSEVMAGRRKHWPEQWIEYIVKHYDFESEVAAHYAAMRGLEVKAPREWTDSEIRRRLAIVSGDSPDIGRIVSERMHAIPDEEVVDG
jgi:hypothetical protein